MSDPHPDKELQALTQALQSLAPDPGRLDRDRLMFDAGRAAAGRSRLWPLATYASSTVAALLAMIIVVRPSPAPVIQVVHVPVMKFDDTANPVVGPPEDRPLPFAMDTWEPESAHARLQDHLLRRGLDLPALPPLPEGAGPSSSEMRIDRGGMRMSGLFTSWLLSGGAKQ